MQKPTKQEKAEIHLGDETGIQNDAYNAKGFAPKGETPVVRINATKSWVDMISPITAKPLKHGWQDMTRRLRFFIFRLIHRNSILMNTTTAILKTVSGQAFRHVRRKP